MKTLALSLATCLAISNAASAVEMCKKNPDLRVQIPKNILDRTQEIITEKGLKGIGKIAYGSDKYQGVWMNIRGTGNCLVATHDGKKNADGTLDLTTPLDADDYAKFGTRLGRRINCVLQGVTDSAINVTDGAADLTQGTIQYAGDAMGVDVKNLGKEGLSFFGEAAMNAAQEENFFKGIGSGFGSFFSSTFGLVGQAGGVVFKRVKAVFGVTYSLPRDVAQNTIRGVGMTALELDPAQGAKSAAPIFFRVVSFVPNMVESLVMGCVSETEPLNLDDPAEFERYQHERSGSSF